MDGGLPPIEPGSAKAQTDFMPQGMGSDSCSRSNSPLA